MEDRDIEDSSLLGFDGQSDVARKGSEVNSFQIDQLIQTTRNNYQAFMNIHVM